MIWPLTPLLQLCCHCAPAARASRLTCYTRLDASASTLPSPWNGLSYDAWLAHLLPVFAAMSPYHTYVPRPYKVAFPAPLPALCPGAAYRPQSPLFFSLVLSLGAGRCVCLFTVILSAPKWEDAHASREQGLRVLSLGHIPSPGHAAWQWGMPDRYYWATESAPHIPEWSIISSLPTSVLSEEPQLVSLTVFCLFESYFV